MSGIYSDAFTISDIHVGEGIVSLIVTFLYSKRLYYLYCRLTLKLSSMNRWLKES